MINKAIVLFGLTILASQTGCQLLDFGGIDKKPVEVKFFWDKAPSIGAEDPNHPGYDKDGNKIPLPGTYTTFALPDIYAGTNIILGSKTRVTPVIGIEIFEVKLPIIRWIVIQIQAGSNLLDVAIEKKLTNIFPITVGVAYGRDFNTNEYTWSIGISIIKF